ncbi:hypothetical protein [Streptomyces sp. CAU 1734]|uniref:hypothetical protein n=1 Tax=Streptomyces sp. CAU 1734 TaxID=3140360 RepID=UPI003260F254
MEDALMATPYLSFEVPDPGAVPAGYVTRTGDRSFRLYEYQRRYPLPVVVLHPAHEPGSAYLGIQLPERLVVRPAPGTDLHPALPRALGTDWSSDREGAAKVAGRLVLVRDAWISALHVHWGGTPHGGGARNPGEPLLVDTRWEIDYQGPAGRDTLSHSVQLEFAPPGEEPAAVPQSDPVPEFLPLREPSGTHHQEYVVVDFGTTASTVTLQNAAKLRRHAIDPDQCRALGAFLTELLTLPEHRPDEPERESDPGARVPAEWRAAVTALLEGELVLRGSTEERVTGHQALALVAEGGEEAVSALQLAVEQAYHHAGRELRSWLVPRLHAGYTRVTETPPLDLHELRPVGFPGADGSTTHAPPSCLVEVAGGETEESAPAAPEHRAFRLADEQGAVSGLKRLVMRSKPPGVPGSDLSAVHLSQYLYLELVRAAERLTADTSHPGSTIQTVIVTYPTTVLPEVKRRLGALVGAALGAPRVVTDYDEGLAAGLFFVMRELSGNQNLGLEALRARSRRVTRTLPPAEGAEPGTGRTLPVSPPTWHRTMLVIDIGGGTTDIALIQLVLVDETPPRPDGVRKVAGRRYRLEPTLLGSTGHEQLGGDLLTLQVFYWLKAVMIDALLEPDGEGAGTGPPGRSLAAQVADQAARHLDTIVHPRIKETLDSCLPTSWDVTLPDEQQGRPRDRFHDLWRLAEAKKRALSAAAGTGPDGARQPVVLEPHEVAEIVKGRPKRLREPAAALPLDPEQFRKLMLPVLQRAAEMGADLVRTTFTREHERNAAAAAEGRETGPEPVLDQVVLSGRSSSMDLVRGTVTDVLSRADAGHQLKFGWNPAALSIETGFAAKQATSLGAAWAHGVRARARVVDTVRDGDRVAHPRMTDLDIVTHGLFSSLPCDLGPLAGAKRPVVLLRAGEPFVELDERGTLGVRSAWNVLPRMVELHRITSASRSIQWGSFDLVLAAERDRIDLTTPVWHPQRQGGVRYLVEVDQELYPQILLCNGRPHYFVDGTRHHLDLAELVPGAVFEPDLGRCRLPGRLCVKTADGGLAEVFPRPRAGAEDDWFTESFHPDAEGGRRTVAGRTAVVPVPPIRGQYEFHLDDGGGNPVRLDSLPVPESAIHGRQRLHTATLDARGRLSVFRGAVPFAPALNLRDMERGAGLVYRRPMDEGRSDFQDEWNPFTGGH